MILLAIAVIAIAYQVVAILACIFFRASRGSRPAPRMPVSILKPVHGLDAGFRDAIASHAALQGDFELLCGVANLDDSAVLTIREFPAARVIQCPSRAPNGKAAVLGDLARLARNPILVVNDADIRVEPDYLSRVAAPLADPGVGLVTCLYRPVARNFAARFEGLAVSTDFAPSTLVARMFGVDEFALGSTLAFRRADDESADAKPKPTAKALTNAEMPF